MSKKKKKVKKKKKQHRPNSNMRQLTQNFFKNKMPGVKIIQNDAENKLSETIIDFTEPLLNMCRSYKDKEKILSLAILVWNMCIIPKKEAEALRKSLCKNICGNDQQAIKDMDEIVNYLIARKNYLFKDDKRFIVSYNITKRKGGLYLDVAYSQTN